eukprot:s6215_g4.t1
MCVCGRPAFALQSAEGALSSAGRTSEDGAGSRNAFAAHCPTQAPRSSVSGTEPRDVSQPDSPKHVVGRCRRHLGEPQQRRQRRGVHRGRSERRLGVGALQRVCKCLHHEESRKTGPELR